MSQETNHNEDDEDIEERDCRNCGRTDHKLMGMVPHSVVVPGLGHDMSTVSWVDAVMCLSCGSISVKTIDEEKIQETIDEIVDLYEEHELAEQAEIDALRR